MAKRFAYVVITILWVLMLAGCGTKLGRNIEKSLDNTQDGLTDTKTNIEDQLSKSCRDTLKVSEDADEVLRLVSSEENTVFTVDGKEMGKAKQLKVCINSKSKHTVVAAPAGCEEKIERLAPPYDFPIYEFRFMLGDCKAAAKQPANNTPPKTTKRSRS